VDADEDEVEMMIPPVPEIEDQELLGYDPEGLQRQI
jgi:hypothetical protein